MARSGRDTVEDSAASGSALAPHVRDALRHLHDPTRLQVHPLARALGLTRLGDPNVGRALHRRLLDAVEAIRPAKEVGIGSHAWRAYDLLRLRYVEALDASAAQEKLSISRSEYHRDHNQAIEALASLLLDGATGAAVGEPRMALDPRKPSIGGKVGPAIAPTNLPLQLTSFVGRQREMAELMSLLDSSRLLTLTGSGGCGKTRLALEVARHILEARAEADIGAEKGQEYSDGVYIVELAALSDPALVPQTVASWLGVHEVPGVPVESTLSDHLRDKRLLLLLDNCEHLLEACAGLVESLLSTCPSLSIVTTSREPLGVYGETHWRVPSLSVPEPGKSLPLETLVGYDSVRLFVERGRLARPGFSLTEENAALVAEVCWRLDGIPLALELAAARLEALSLEQLSSRLDDRFRLLTGGRRKGLQRQQTLRGAIDWSHQLLSAEEQVLFRRLAVFSGGWRLEAAEAVCGRGEIESTAVLDLLSQLVRKSLVVVEEVGGQSRYRFLETIRQYAGEKLREAGEERDTRDRHKAWFRSFVAPPPDWDSAQPKSNWTATNAIVRGNEVVAEQDNLRAALEWCLETDPGAGLVIARLLWLVWMNRGQPTEGRRWLEGFLARAPERTLDRALALVGSGQFAEDQGDFDAAECAAEEAVAIFREHGDQQDICWGLMRLGTAAQEKGDLDRARAVFEECLAQTERSGYHWPEPYALQELGISSLLTGDRQGALRYFERAMPVASALELSSEEVADSLAFQGRAWKSLGDYARARKLLEEAVTDFRRIDQKACIAWGTGELGYVLACIGEHEQAEALLRESLGLLRSQGHRHRACRVLYIYGLLANNLGDHAKGCRLIAVAAARHTTPQTILDPAERAEVDASLAAARAALGEEGFARAWAEGQTMTLDEAVEYALGK